MLMSSLHIRPVPTLLAGADRQHVAPIPVSAAYSPYCSVLGASVKLRAGGIQAVRQLQQSRRRRAASFAVVAVAAPSGEKPVILVAEKLGKPGLQLLEEYGTVDASYDLTPEQLIERIPSCDALIIRSATKVTRAVIEAAKGRLKVVGRAGVGVDNVDLTAATEYGCLVVNAPTANTVAAAEHGIALIAALSRNVAQADASVKAGRWERSKYVGVSIVGKTLAIMGFGKVGSEVARRGFGLGFASVIAYDPFASKAKASALGVKLVSFDEALATADFFSIHMPLTPDTKGIFGEAAFAKMKRGARVVNVARGGVIDDAALARALDEGIVAQAALDVFTQEPPPADNPLVGRADVVCTPHLGASTAEAQEDVAVEIAEVVVAALEGKVVATAVNAPMVPPEVLAELQPYVALAQGLARAAVQLVATDARGFSEVFISYASSRGDELDTRLLRAMVIKGILEQITTSTVNLVNADLLAKTRGLRITESTVPSEGQEVLASMRVALGTSETKFSAAVNPERRVSVTGEVKGGAPYLTQIGSFDVELAMEGIVLLTRQRDQPGIVGAVASLLAGADINISFMTVARAAPRTDAIMALGVDELPPEHVLAEVPKLPGIVEFATFSE